MKYKKSIITAVFLLLAQVMVYADQKTEKFNSSMKKWREAGIFHYYIKVDYKAFSPREGIWEIEVKNGRSVSAVLGGKTGENYLNFSERFTLESLYKTAESSLKTEDNSPMIILVEYNDETGFIKSISRVNNPEYKGRVKMDAGYLIRVLEFHPLK